MGLDVGVDVRVGAVALVDETAAEELSLDVVESVIVVVGVLRSCFVTGTVPQVNARSPFS